MLEFLFPDLYCGNIYDIDYERLSSENKKAILFDIDNTLAPFDVPSPPRQVVAHMQMLQNAGFSLCLFSNNGQSRVENFNQELGLPFVYRAKKPRSWGIKKALTLLGSRADQTVLVGDQIFTDVWCGNRCGLFTILVKPVAPRDEWSVKLKRGLEKKVIDLYLKKRGKQLDIR